MEAHVRSPHVSLGTVPLAMEQVQGPVPLLRHVRGDPPYSGYSWGEFVYWSCYFIGNT